MTELNEFGAKLNATIYPNGFQTSYHFEYGQTDGYGSVAPVPNASAGSGTGSVPVSTAISRLSPGTVYHARIVAEYDGTQVVGNDIAFRTPGQQFARGLSNGSGISTWEAAITQKPPAAVATGDVNADGKADAVSVLSDGNGKYRYMLGLSNGSAIASWTPVLTGMARPVSLALGDLTGDGKADIVAVEDEGNGFYRYMLSVSNGTGFSGWTQLLGHMSTPTKVAVGDVTGDKKADIVAVESEGDGHYRYMLGKSAGTSISGWTQMIGGLKYAEFMDVGDLTGDGKADVVSVEAIGEGRYRYMLGKSNGAGISSWETIQPNMNGPYFFHLGDVNGDKKADIVTLEENSPGQYRYMLGVSNGSGVASWTPLLGNVSLPVQMNVGDLTGDGKADLVAVETETTGSYVYKLGTSIGTGISSWKSMATWMRGSYGLAVGDMTGDGRADIVSLESEGNGKYQYVLGVGGPGGVTTSWTPILGGMSVPVYFALGDLTGDGKADLIAVEPEGSKYTYRVGISSGTGISGWNPLLRNMTRPVGFAVGDFTGDKKADIVAVEPEGSSYTYRVGISNGSGIPNWNPLLPNMSRPTQIALGDLTGDGKADLVAVEPEGSTYTYRIGVSNGSGIPNWNPLLQQATKPVFFGLGDVTGDKKADIVAVEPEGSTYTYRVGISNGSGIPNWNPLLRGLSLPSALGVGDLDGDGKADVVGTENIH